MLGKEVLLKQWEYNRWANDRVLELAGKIIQVQFVSSSTLGRSLQEIFFHMLRTDWIWRNLCEQGRIEPDMAPRFDQFKDIKAIKNSLKEEEQRIQALISRWTETELAESVRIHNWDGSESTLIRWHMLVHNMLHNMQHRTEAAVILTSFSQSPGDLDFIHFV